MKTPTGKPLKQSAQDRRTAKPAKKPAYKRATKHAGIPRTKLKRTPKPVPALFIKHGDLNFHPLLKRVGLLPALIAREVEKGNAQGKGRAKHKANAEEMTHDFESLVTSIGNHGIREKVKVVRNPKGGWLIVDGRHRYEAAEEVIRRWVLADNDSSNAVAIQLSTSGLPCEEVPEAEVVPVIMDAVNRRHLSKGARAYLAVLMRPEVTDEKRGGDRSKTAETAVLLTHAKLAAEVGVSETLIKVAVGIFKHFEARPDTRKIFEDAIWVGGDITRQLNGIKGYLATGRVEEEEETEAEAKARIEQDRITTAMEKWVGVKTAFKHWDGIRPESREPVIKAGIDTVLALPEEVRQAISDALLEREF